MGPGHVDVDMPVVRHETGPSYMPDPMPVAESSGKGQGMIPMTPKFMLNYCYSIKYVFPHFYLKPMSTEKC